MSNAENNSGTWKTTLYSTALGKPQPEITPVLIRLLMVNRTRLAVNSPWKTHMELHLQIIIQIHFS